MNLGFDAISQFPISQVAADNVVTITVTGNNLIANIGNPNIAADAVTETCTPVSGPDVANGNADIASNPKLINNP